MRHQNAFKVISRRQTIEQKRKEEGVKPSRKSHKSFDAFISKAPVGLKTQLGKEYGALVFPVARNQLGTQMKYSYGITLGE